MVSASDPGEVVGVKKLPRASHLSQRRAYTPHQSPAPRCGAWRAGIHCARRLAADSASDRSLVCHGMTMYSPCTETEILVSRPVAGPLMRAPSLSWNRELWAAQVMTPSRGGLTSRPRWGHVASNARYLPGLGWVTSTPSTTMPPPSGTFAVAVKTRGSEALAGAEPGGSDGAGRGSSLAHAVRASGRARVAAAPRTARRDLKGSGIAAMSAWAVTVGPPSATGVPVMMMRSEWQTLTSSPS